MDIADSELHKPERPMEALQSGAAVSTEPAVAPEQPKTNKQRQVLWEDAFKKWTHEIGKKDGRTEIVMHSKSISFTKVSQPAGCKHKSHAVGTNQCRLGWPRPASLLDSSMCCSLCWETESLGQLCTQQLAQGSELQQQPGAPLETCHC